MALHTEISSRSGEALFHYVKRHLCGATMPWRIMHFQLMAIIRPIRHAIMAAR